jgi:hypothetical protein
MVLIRCGAVAHLVAAGKPKTSYELAKSTGASEMLIIRMMRPLTALGIFHETDVSTYEATPISQLLATPTLHGGYQFMFDLPGRSLAHMPRFFEKTGFKLIEDPPSSFQDFNNTEDNLFTYMIKRPDMMSNFNAFMAGTLEKRLDWFQKFDAQNIVLDGARRNDPEAVLLLDIAGGRGHDVSSTYLRANTVVTFYHWASLEVFWKQILLFLSFSLQISCSRASAYLNIP